MSMLRSRWAAVGAAVAVTLGAGGASLTQAAIGSGAKPVYVALDAPCRVIDTRSASPIGAGDANTLTVQMTGANGDCTGSLAVPTAAVAVATNVTVMQPNGAPSGRSYFTVYPADAALPTTSNLNFVNGQAPTPNKVDVGLSTDGKIKIYNFDGTAHAAVDIFGYYIDHHHADVYTKTESDDRFVNHGTFVMSNSTADVLPHGFNPAVIEYFSSGPNIQADFGEGVLFSVEGPVSIDGVAYGLTSLEYCVNIATGAVDYIQVYRQGGTNSSVGTDNADRTADGCYSLAINEEAFAYDVVIRFLAGTDLRLQGVRTTWTPVTTSLTSSAVAIPDATDVNTGD